MKTSLLLLFVILSSCNQSGPIYRQCRVYIKQCDRNANPECSNVGFWDYTNHVDVQSSQCTTIDPINPAVSSSIDRFWAE